MNLVKIREIAAREFLATVSTRAFVVGLLLLPAVFTVAFTVLPRLMAQRQRPIVGEIAVVDETGRLTADLQRTLSPEALAERRAAAQRRAQAALPEVRNSPAVLERLVGDVPELTVVSHAAPLDKDREKAWLTRPSSSPHLAVAIVRPAAIDPAAGGPVYDLLVAPNLDTRVESTLYDGVRDAVVAVRSRAEGLDPARVENLMSVPRPPSTTVTGNGERVTNGGFERALPFIFVSLMFMGVMIGGQGLLASTVEEKSSRVVEVMLSAVSPLELMTGKLLGQLLVGLLSMAVYIALGVLGLTSFSMLGLLRPELIVYLLVFWLITYLFMGSVMLAVGAAVNEMREAQSLMMPVTVLLMLPWITAAPILQNPTSTFAVTISFIPPVNTFAMLLRLTSTAPPPAWQVWATAVVGLLAACGAIWCAAKIYRVGLLMYGKAPDFATLFRWVKAA